MKSYPDMNTDLPVHAYIQTYIHTYVHACIHTHIYSHKLLHQHTRTLTWKGVNSVQGGPGGDFHQESHLYNSRWTGAAMAVHLSAPEPTPFLE